MKMKPTVLCLSILLWGQAGAMVASAKPHAQHPSPKVQSETKYLAFQIFTWSPDPTIAGFELQGTSLPPKAPLLETIKDIKGRIGTVGSDRTRLAFYLGPLGCFDQSDAEISNFIKLGFDLAIQTDVAVGFKIDDSMFWARRKDLWTNPSNVEAMDWEGTSSTGRRLDWGKTPTEAPPQMCFNSRIIEREVGHRSRVLGRAIHLGEKRLEALGRSELFAGVIAGSETMIGQDFKTGKYLGYRALMNRGYSRRRPPTDFDRELENVVQEFVDRWTAGLAEAGVSTRKIYSHTAFVSRHVFHLSDNQPLTYSRLNHNAPPSVAFGPNHQPGFSTYPQPGLFDDIYAELAKHKQTAWASSEGTNLQLGSGPGQSGMNMETYLAKMFNHGATLVDIFSWGIGGEANRNMDFRVVTEGEEAIHAYRKFLAGAPLVEAPTTTSYLERLPQKIRRIQRELPAWITKPGNQALVAPLMQALDAALKAKNFEEAERQADKILGLMRD